MSESVTCVTQKMIESEYHFLFTCPAYVDLRNKYFGNCSWPNVRKFVNIMSCMSKCKFYKTAKYIYEAFQLRKICHETEAAS